ncbi:MAG: hypothetical protein P8Q48_04355 [Paracoccaceae bacterium]|nr:hypothetical protein [Paracoccaceae bacterium]
MNRAKIIAEDALGAVFREIWSGEDLHDYSETRKREQAEALTAEQLLGAIEVWASGQLESKGWPSPFEIVEVGADRSWSHRPREETKPVKNAAVGHAFILEEVGALSDEAFLCRIAKHSRWTKDYLVKGNTERLLPAALQLGSQLKELELRRRGLKLAERGNKVAGGARNSAQQTNQRHQKPRAERFARMKYYLDRGLKVTEAARACAKEGLGSKSAIMRQWYRVRTKNRDT